MKNQIRLLMIIAFVAIVGSLFCQPAVKYSYDGSGNRIKRQITIIPPPCNNCPENGRMSSGNQAKISSYTVGVFPNPALDKINVNIENFDVSKKSSLLLTDEAGKTLIKLENISVENVINVDQIQPGVYFLKITIDQESKVYKILKI